MTERQQPHMTEQQSLTKLTEGKWGDVPWIFYIDTKLPKTELCTAVFGVPILQDGRVVIIRHHNNQDRGWELPGGHPKPATQNRSGETPLEALTRELWEETGMLPLSPKKVIGYK